MSTFYELLLAKSVANLRTEISKYYLNYLWWVIDPIVTMIVFYFVFGVFLNRGTGDFAAFLIIGTVFWQWFANGVSQSANCIIVNKGLMLQVNIPKVFFPLEIVLRGTFKHLFALSVLLLFLVFYPTPTTITWTALPVLMLIQFLYIVACGIICSAIVPFIPDLSFVIKTLIQLGMFGSGIFYNIDSVVLPEHRFIIYSNPMAGLLKNYREILMYDRWPDWEYLGYISIGGLVLLTIAVVLVGKLDHIYPRICQQ